MGITAEFAKQVKVKVTKSENDGRVLLMGEPVQVGDDGKEFFIIPGHCASYVRDTCPGWNVSEEFLPEKK